jgi:hypothetical protein
MPKRIKYVPNIIKYNEAYSKQHTVYASIHIQSPPDSLVCNNFLNPLPRSVSIFSKSVYAYINDCQANLTEYITSVFYFSVQ